MSIVDKEKSFLVKHMMGVVRILGIASVAAVAFSVYLLLENMGNTLSPKETKEFASTAVKITNLQANSGGTGVILLSTTTSSVILTNKHVCELLPSGGLVHTVRGEMIPVHSYKRYKFHDLCMVTVKEDLGVNTKIAKHAPELYTDAVISGHPNLLPHVLSKGSFSGKQIIPILMRIDKCQNEDLTGEWGNLCKMFGVKPVIELFYSQLVTGIILPGSSGSAIYNKDGEISALVFAGGGDGFSYAYAVPYEYIADFVSTQLNNKFGWISVDGRNSGSSQELKTNKVVFDKKEIEAAVKVEHERLNKSK